VGGRGIGIRFGGFVVVLDVRVLEDDVVVGPGAGVIVGVEGSVDEVEVVGRVVAEDPLLGGGVEASSISISSSFV